MTGALVASLSGAVFGVQAANPSCEELRSPTKQYRGPILDETGRGPLLYGQPSGSILEAQSKLGYRLLQPDRPGLASPGDVIAIWVEGGSNGTGQMAVDYGSCIRMIQELWDPPSDNEAFVDRGRGTFLRIAAQFPPGDMAVTDLVLERPAGMRVVPVLEQFEEGLSRMASGSTIQVVVGNNLVSFDGPPGMSTDTLKEVAATLDFSTGG